MCFVFFLELCRYTGVNNSANIRPSSPMLINANTENIFREFYLWKAVCTTQKCFLCILFYFFNTILCFLSHLRDKGHWVTAQNRSRKYPVLPQSMWGKQLWMTLGACCPGMKWQLALSATRLETSAAVMGPSTPHLQDRWSGLCIMEIMHTTNKWTPLVWIRALFLSDGV